MVNPDVLVVMTCRTAGSLWSFLFNVMLVINPSNSAMVVTEICSSNYSNVFQHVGNV